MVHIRSYSKFHQIYGLAIDLHSFEMKILDLKTIQG